MTRRAPVNVGASVRVRLLKLSKERQEDFTLTLVNYASERFLYRLSRSKHRERFIVKGAVLLAVRIGETYRPTRDIDLLGTGEASDQAIETALRDIVATAVEDDALVFDADTLEIHAIREDNRYGGLRARMMAHLVGARIPLQIDVGFGDVITPGSVELDFPTLLEGMPSPRVLVYSLESAIAEKVEAMVSLGMLNSRMRDFFDVALTARRMSFDGEIVVRALPATFRRRGTAFPDDDIVALSEKFTFDPTTQVNWKAFAQRSAQREFETLGQVTAELRRFLLEPLKCAKAAAEFAARWPPGGPWR